MKVIKPSYKILSDIEPIKILQAIERAGRVCYKSEGNITENSAIKFVEHLIRRGHESVLEHQSLSVLFICDRGVSHEIVRHRIASYSQESTRYCNYGHGNKGVVFISPCFFSIPEGEYHLENIMRNSDFSEAEICWLNSMINSENHYNELIELGRTPQEARSVLPNSLKTEIICTYNLREWRHFFKLRTAVSAHPQMRQLIRPLLDEFKKSIPAIFDDIIYSNPYTF